MDRVVFLECVIFVSFSYCFSVILSENSCQAGVETCEFYNWNPWSACSKVCGGGQSCRLRSLCCIEEYKNDPYACLKNCSHPVVDSYQCKICNQFCYNGGYFNGATCECRPGTNGVCCENGSPVTQTPAPTTTSKPTIQSTTKTTTKPSTKTTTKTTTKPSTKTTTKTTKPSTKTTTETTTKPSAKTTTETTTEPSTTTTTETTTTTKPSVKTTTETTSEPSTKTTTETATESSTTTTTETTTTKPSAKTATKTTTKPSTTTTTETTTKPSTTTTTETTTKSSVKSTTEKVASSSQAFSYSGASKAKQNCNTNTYTDCHCSFGMKKTKTRSILHDITFGGYGTIIGFLFSIGSYAFWNCCENRKKYRRPNGIKPIKQFLQ